MARPMDGTNSDLDLDRLMARVREAAVSGDCSELTLDKPTGDAGDGLPDAAQALAVQAQFNEHVTKSLAAIVECLQNLQQVDTRPDPIAARPAMGVVTSRVAASIRRRTDKASRPRLPKKRRATAPRGNRRI
jgi:hypothetical protein